MRIAVCDDEKQGIEYICKILSKNSEYDVIGYDNVESLLSDIESGLSFSIIFLDIEFPGQKCDGIECAQKIFDLCPSSQIIFVTGYNNKYSQEIFRQGINLCGFLVKPVSEKRLNYLMDKATENIKNTNADCLLLNINKSIRMIPHNKIIYIESKGHKVIVHTKDENIEVYDKLDNICYFLPKYFCRNHKSFTVNLSYVMKLDGYIVEMGDGRKLPISRAKREETFSKFTNYVRQNIV